MAIRYYYGDGTTSSERNENKILHRIDGPAINFWIFCPRSSIKQYFIDGKEYNELDFHKFIENIKMLDPILQLTDERWWVRELGKQNEK